MMITPTFHALTIADIRHETAEAILVAFAVRDELAAAYRYVTGQYLTLRTTLGELRRTYSTCTALEDNDLRVCIDRVPDGVFPGWAHDTSRVGAMIDVMTPGGRFHQSWLPACSV